MELRGGGKREDCYCGAVRIVGGAQPTDWRMKKSVAHNTDAVVEAILVKYQHNNPHGATCRCNACVLCEHIIRQRKRRRLP